VSAVLFGAPLAAAIALAPATPPPADCRPDAPDVRAVRAVADGIVAADNRSEIEQVLAYYTADAVLMPPGSAPVRGRDAIRPRYEALFAGFKPAIEGRIDEACAAGAVGFVRGHNGGRMVPLGVGSPRALDDVYLMVLRREADGAWRISHLMWHPGAGPQP
jgi:uncharacterized protein (TIGR02246 family)